MATQKQIDANPRNAQRSTGPKTQAGKAISARNALTHGLRPRAALPPGEDKDAFLRVFKAFRKEYRPIGPFQEALVEQMIVAYCKLSCLNRIETHIYRDKSAPDTFFSDLRKFYFHRDHEPDSHPEPPKNKPKPTPDELLERSFLRAHHELPRPKSSP
jgi:hypothetical protein